MDDFTGVFAGLSVAGGVSAIIAAGVILAAPFFASWLVNKVATFFDGDEGVEDSDEQYTPCLGCGEEYFPSVMDENSLCAGCHDYSEDN